MRKTHYFSIIFKEFNNPCVQFLCVWTKTAIYLKFWENLRKFRKKLPKKIAKNGIFLAYFAKPFTKHALIFFRVWSKNTIFGNFEKVLEDFSKILKKIANTALDKHFSIDLINHALIFRAFGRKTKSFGRFLENFKNLWWNFYRKIDFFIFYLYSFLKICY